MIRLVVVDTPSPPTAWIPEGADEVTEHASHGVAYLECTNGDTRDRIVTVDGPLHQARGNPPNWEPRRRAAVRALGKLATSADALVVSSDDPLFAVQVRDTVCTDRPDLLRTTRCASPPYDVLRDIDDMAGESRALACEIDAIVAYVLHRIDPGLRLHDLPALCMVGATPRSRASLVADGIPESSLVRLAEHGYLVDEPAWRSPAADALREVLPPVMLDRATGTHCDAWIDAVARGTLDRPTALRRVHELLEGAQPPPKPRDFDCGRLIGPCPRCGDWMGGARRRMRCMGCGAEYPLPRGVEARAVPGATCATCDAPLIRPVIHGRAHAIRCPDRAGCPEAMDAPR